MALGLWFVANMEQGVERNYPVAVTYENLPSGLIIVNKPPEKLNITARGSRGKMASISHKNLRYSIDLSTASAGISKYEIHTDQIKVPTRGIQVVGITPAEIRIDVDKVARKKVAVRPVIGPPDSGYQIVSEPKADPKKVKVKGPKRFLSNLKSIPTDTVSLAGAKSKFTIEVPLLPPPLVDVLKKDKVKVTVDIKEIISVKEFKNLSVEFVNFDKLNYNTPKENYKSDLVFEGPYDVIKDLKSDDIKVYVDGAGLNRKLKDKRQSLEVNVSYPYGDRIALKKKKPERISISLN